jgi:hypothetical protein
MNEDIYSPMEVQEIQYLRHERKAALWAHQMARTDAEKSRAIRDIRRHTKRLHELTGLHVYSPR